MGPQDWRFFVVDLDRLRRAARSSPDTLDDIWTKLSNDQFFDLRQYVQTHTGLVVEGYGSREPAGAFAAVMDTLDALDRIVARLNRSLLLCSNVRTAIDHHRAADEQRANDGLAEVLTSIAPDSPDRALSQQLVNQIKVSLTGLSTASPSHMVAFGPTSTGSHLGLALSGGGTRAATFAIGPILHLLDVDQYRNVEQINSVSGGSLTNGYIANTTTLEQPLTAEHLEPFARRLVDKGAPLEQFGRQFATYLTFAAVFALAAVVTGVIALRDALWWWLPVLLLAAAAYLAAIVWYLVVLSTNEMIELWIRRTLNPTQPERTPHLAMLLRRRRLRSMMDTEAALRSRELHDVPGPVNHVFSTTDLRHGEHLHLSSQWVMSATYGASDPGDVRIDEAIRASAAFPGALPPVTIDLARLSLPPGLTTGDKHLRLADGGIRDNLGHIFQTRLLDGVDEEIRHLTHYGNIGRWIVVDASAPRGVADLSEGMLQRVPGLRRIPQLTTFPRVIGIMNQSNSEARALTLDHGLRRDRAGFVISIKDSPFDVCRRAIGDDASVDSLLAGRGSTTAHEGRARRAVDVLRALVRTGDTEASWAGDVGRNSATATTLDGIGADRVVSIMRHAYVLTMTHCALEWGWDLPPDSCWSRARFEQLIAGAAPSAQPEPL